MGGVGSTQHACWGQDCFFFPSCGTGESNLGLWAKCLYLLVCLFLWTRKSLLIAILVILLCQENVHLICWFLHLECLPSSVWLLKFSCSSFIARADASFLIKEILLYLVPLESKLRTLFSSWMALLALPFVLTSLYLGLTACGPYLCCLCHPYCLWFRTYNNHRYNSVVECLLNMCRALVWSPTLGRCGVWSYTFP